MSREPSNQFEPISNFGSNLCDDKWKGWCRLCAKADEYCVNVISGVYQKFPNDTSFNYDINLAYLIAKYFQIQIQEDEKLSRVICLECYKYITALSKFGERVSNVQQMYDELYNCKDKTKFDVDLLLEKYDLSKNESVLAHHENEVPIEEIFVAGLAVTVETDPTIVNIKKEAVTVAEQIDTTLPIHNEDDDDPIGDKEQDKEESCTQLDSDISSSSEENYSDDNATSSTNIRKRLQKNSGENLEKHTCIICSQCFQRRRNYATHMKRKHDVIVCPECPSSFKNILNLKKHILEHRNAFNCSQCEQKFEKKSILSKHVKDVHRKPVGKFVCEACGEAMVTKRELTLHMLIHTDYIPFKCKDCGMCFKEKYRFKRHCEIHRDKVICPICGKQLSCQATFKNHMLVHSDQMNHKCDYCGREFKRAKGLKSHLLLHSGLKPYSCEFCERTFDNRSNCRFHMKLKHPNELTELEASGQKTYTSVPRLEELKSLVRRSEYLKPVNLKRGGGKLTSQHFHVVNSEKSEMETQSSKIMKEHSALSVFEPESNYGLFCHSVE